jgi:DNA-binding winged helix-turn-helix (wHTH) protein/tetratricopeptide (TPR) repeat protein
VSSSRAVYEFGPYRLDVGSRLLTRGPGEPVPLTPKAFDTLAVLLERHGRVVSKEELLEAVWPGVFIEEATLTQNVYTLRKALGEGSDDSLYIQTVPRRGYRFAVPVSSAATTQAVALPGSAPAKPAPRTIAVLPFAALGAEAEKDFLGLGMADAVITRLTHVRSLTVRATSAVLRYVGQTPDPVTVGKDLAVDAVLEGTVQRAETRVRATVRLVSVADGRVIWADKLDTVATDIFTLQDHLSERVADALRLELTAPERQGLSRRATESTEAYQAYVRGRYFWDRRTEENLHKAITYFRQALDRDPLYARAYAGLADSFVLLPLYGSAAPRDAFPKAQEAANRALDLDDELAEAHTSLAYTRFFFDRHWDAAEASFLRALAANPRYATAHHWYSFFLAARGRQPEARDHALRAVELDPLSLVINADLAFVHYFARRPEEALVQFGRTLELDPTFAYAHLGTALALAEQGELGAAVLAGERAVALSNSSFALAALGRARALAGDVSGAEAVLRELDGRARSQHVQANYAALVLLALGRNADALDRLEQAFEEGSHFVAFLKVWPVYDPLRGLARFGELCERVGV